MRYYQNQSIKEVIENIIHDANLDSHEERCVRCAFDQLDYNGEERETLTSQIEHQSEVVESFHDALNEIKHKLEISIEIIEENL